MVPPAPDARGRLRLAFVGCGAIARWHLAALRTSAPRTDVSAVVDLDADRAGALAGAAEAFDPSTRPSRGELTPSSSWCRTASTSGWPSTS